MARWLAATAVVTGMQTALMAQAQPATQRSIFDDAPSEIQSKPRDLMAPRPPAPQPAQPILRPAPAPLAPAGPLPPIAAPAPAERLPVPAPAALAPAERLVRELFRTEYAQRMPAQRQLLARKLLSAAATAADKPAERFVLLREARSVAEQAGDMELALQAIDTLARSFAIEPIEAKLEVLRKIGLDANPAQARSTGEKAMELGAAALAEEKLDLAARAAAVAELYARNSRDTAFVRSTGLRATELRAAQQVFASVPAARDKLAASPANGEASLTMGRYLCFIKEQWSDGLPHLAMGSDATLRALAERELAQPSGAAALQLADGWWEQSEKQPGLGKTAMQRHSATWYQKMLPQLSGLERMIVEKRMAEANVKPAAAAVVVVPAQPANVGSVPQPVVVVVPAQPASVSTGAQPAAGGARPQPVRFGPIPQPAAGGDVRVAPDDPIWLRQITHAEVHLSRDRSVPPINVLDTVKEALQKDPFLPVFITPELLASLGHRLEDPRSARVSVGFKIGERRGDHNFPLSMAMIPAPMDREGMELPGASQPFHIVAARLGIGTTWTDVTNSVRGAARDPAQVYRIAREDIAPNAPIDQRIHLAVWYEHQGRRQYRCVPVPGYLRLMP